MGKYRFEKIQNNEFQFAYGEMPFFKSRQEAKKFAKAFQEIMKYRKFYAKGWRLVEKKPTREGERVMGEMIHRNKLGKLPTPKKNQLILFELSEEGSDGS